MSVANPFFSIVVPTYNRGELLLKTLRSLLGQDRDDYEIIVVDDGSTDNTKELVQGLLSPKLKYHKISNRERGAARNYGALQALGKYVNFFDSDDLADQNHCSLAAKIIAEHPSIPVFSLSYRIENEDGKVLSSKSLNKPVRTFIFRGNHLSCNGVFIKKEVIIQNPFSEDRALSGSEDYELWMRLAARFEFPCFPFPSHAVIHHKNRSTLNFDPQPLIRRKELMLETAYRDEKVEEVFGPKKNILYASAYSYIALHLALAGSPAKEVLGWLKKAIAENPRCLLTRRTVATLKHLYWK